MGTSLARHARVCARWGEGRHARAGGRKERTQAGRTARGATRVVTMAHMLNSLDPRVPLASPAPPPPPRGLASAPNRHPRCRKPVLVDLCAPVGREGAAHPHPRARRRRQDDHSVSVRRPRAVGHGGASASRALCPARSANVAVRCCCGHAPHPRAPQHAGAARVGTMTACARGARFTYGEGGAVGWRRWAGGQIGEVVTTIPSTRALGIAAGVAGAGSCPPCSRARVCVCVLVRACGGLTRLAAASLPAWLLAP